MKWVFTLWIDKFLKDLYGLGAMRNRVFFVAILSAVFSSLSVAHTARPLELEGLCVGISKLYFSSKDPSSTQNSFNPGKLAGDIFELLTIQAEHFVKINAYASQVILAHRGAQENFTEKNRSGHLGSVDFEMSYPLYSEDERVKAGQKLRAAKQELDAISTKLIETNPEKILSNPDTTGEYFRRKVSEYLVATETHYAGFILLKENLSRYISMIEEHKEFLNQTVKRKAEALSFGLIANLLEDRVQGLHWLKRHDEMIGRLTQFQASFGEEITTFLSIHELALQNGLGLESFYNDGIALSEQISLFIGILKQQNSIASYNTNIQYPKSLFEYLRQVEEKLAEFVQIRNSAINSENELLTALLKNAANSPQ